ncbi:MAG: restriction endonuclease [Pseudomonadota bacterium]
MPNAWMIRAGRGGMYSEEFEKGFVAIGWGDLGDLNRYRSTGEIRAKYIELYGNDKPSRTANAVAIILKFRDQIKKDDFMLSYNGETREYLFGRDKGEYCYKENVVGSFPQLRTVDWIAKVSRDKLSQKARNSLGSVLTMFSVNTEIVEEIQAILAGTTVIALKQEDILEDVAELKDETVERSHELIKDRIVSLSPDKMEDLTASILRAMGYKAKVSPKGPDRGVDVIASPDGLGLTRPRIKAEVKHRSGAMGSQAIRSFIGALRDGDSGLFISTGGFSKEARYEAERSTFPLTLIDLDDLAGLIVSHYENFDLEGRALVPLVRIYWPVD